MNAYTYLYHYLQQRRAVQRQPMHEASAAPMAIDAAAPAVATIAARWEQHG